MSNQLFTEVSLYQQETVVGAGQEYRSYPTYPVKKQPKYSPCLVKDEGKWKEEPKDDEWSKKDNKITKGNGSVTFNLYFDDINFDDFIIYV